MHCCIGYYTTQYTVDYEETPNIQGQHAKRYN